MCGTDHNNVSFCTDVGLHVAGEKLDISAASKGSLSDKQKQELIANRKPPPGFVFPATQVTDSRLKSEPTKRFCQHEYFNMYETLTYSYTEDAVYCLPCALSLVTELAAALQLTSSPEAIEYGVKFKLAA